MSSAQKIIQAAAGNAAGEGLYVEEVFSTYLYDANLSSGVVVNNGINLLDEGGLIWTKCRNFIADHGLYDSERTSFQKLLRSNTTTQQLNSGTHIQATTTGYTIDSTGYPETNNNNTGARHVSWTFRKAPKFFDVVTYTGDGTTSRTIAHNLDSVPGSIIVKRTDSASNWAVYHRSIGATKALILHGTNAQFSSDWFGVTPTSSNFYLSDSDGAVNASGGTYVAYLFAHNDGDGEFGEDADQDIIKCGSYTGTGAAGNFVDLGFEPQWVLIKRTNASADWFILDVMRGASASSYAFLEPNLADSETVGGSSVVEPKATGFNLNNTGTNHNGSGSTYIYIAIRRGPMKTPESGTEVFAIDTKNVGFPSFISGFPVDMGIQTQTTGDSNLIASRLTGPNGLKTDSTAAEDSNSGRTWDYMNGWYDWSGAVSTNISWMFRRAPGFFDVVADTGTGTAKTVNHNLGVVPELMIRKGRETLTGNNNWVVYASAEGATKGAYLTTNAFQASSSFWNDTTPTASVFSVGTGNVVNQSDKDFITYLFASVPGVSKVGSYTGTDADTTIDCGFSNGARFILIKRTDASGDWYVLDSERGLTTGSDPWIELNTADAQSTGNMINVRASGFGVSSGAGTNGNSTINILNAEYIFLAIA